MVWIACIGCDGVFGLVHVADQIDASAAYGDGKLIDDSSMADARYYDGPVSDAAPQGIACDPVGNPGDSCTCVYDGTGCMTGYDCAWQYADDKTPKQIGLCVTTGTIAVGQSCPINGDQCVPGTWCMWNSNSGATGTGTCFQICDPQNKTAHGCSGIMPCVPMPYCVQASDYPNCNYSTNSPLGYCP